MTLQKTPEQAGIELPAYVPLPAGLAFRLYSKQGQTLYISGHISDAHGTEPIRGRLGEDVDVETGREAARRVALNLLATLNEVAGGLENVARILKLTGFVASADDFTAQPAVINAASEIFADLWGESGLHARSAIGVAQLPFGAPVEIELIVELEPE